jgi:hypothetical protein
LELYEESDRLGRGKCLGQLGYIFRERFEEARTENKAKNELLRYLNTAAEFYHHALEFTPPNAVDDLVVIYSQLGIIFNAFYDLY